MTVRLTQLVCLLSLAVAVVFVSPHVMIDPDALTNLAVGRHIATAGEVSAADPFTFGAPGRRWSNPEWLGSLIWYGAWRLGGEGGLQILKLSLLAGAWCLLLLLALRQGAPPVLALGLLLLLLPGTAWRFTLRNHLHLFWLVPLYGLVLQAAARPGGRRWLWGLIPLALLWANLHASFVVGWVLVAAALAGALARRDGALARALAAALLLHPLLAMVSPHGVYNYGQLLDHLAMAPLLRGQIQEWRGPAATVAASSRAPLLLMMVVGVASFLPRYNRRDGQGLLLLLAGLAAAVWAQRFIPLLVFLAAPAVAAALGRVLARVSPPLRRLAVGLTLIIGALGAARLARDASAEPLPPLLQRPGSATGVARFIARDAPRGWRLFNDYNSGPVFLWLAHGKGGRLYIDPRNNLGADRLGRYLEQLPRPARFQREVEALGITLAHVDLGEQRSRPLAVHLGRSPGWALVYFDGAHALYARRSAGNRGLIRRFELLGATPPPPGG